MTTFNLPDLGEGLPEAEIVSWHVKEGDEVKVDDLLVSVETAKAVVEVPSPYTGVIAKLHARAGDIVETGKPLVEFRLAGEAETPAEPATAAAADSGTVVGSMPMSDEVLVEQAVAGGTRRTRPGRVKAAPAVRALAKKLGVDLGALDGSGKAAVSAPKMALGSLQDGTVRLGRAGKILGLAEGIETALSAQQVFELPVWAVLGSRFDRVAIPASVIELQISADNGAPGQEAAAMARDALTKAGKRVAIRRPPESFSDWNDALPHWHERSAQDWEF